ncbi:unnamed protein product [Larinioides sclopetarius]|uniref:Uncharacterized protein n=1 Tax=Larinioides sclopetarius TaxID=280406 RepID=A0AAV2B0E2_9ARAC
MMRKMAKAAPALLQSISRVRKIGFQAHLLLIVTFTDRKL